MTIKIAINGYGRIGRNIVRAIFESGQQQTFDVVAIMGSFLVKSKLMAKI